MYVTGNPKTKKELKDWIKEGRKLRVYAPGVVPEKPGDDGKCTVEGPHYPRPHTWYGTATVDGDGIITGVK